MDLTTRHVVNTLRQQFVDERTLTAQSETGVTATKKFGASGRLRAEKGVRSRRGRKRPISKARWQALNLLAPKFGRAGQILGGLALTAS